MMKKYKSWISWSTGKDSAFALFKALGDPTIEVCGLFSTVTQTFDRVSMHSTRRELLIEQAHAVNLPLLTVEIPDECSQEVYANKMNELIQKAIDQNINAMIFGDLFLESVREYCEQSLAATGITPLFPLWKYDTKQLANDFIASGFKTIITCIDSKKIPPNFAGRVYDQSFLEDLPPHVDPCGENGEFHTFTYAGPIFSHPIKCQTGKTVQKGEFYFTDILLN